MSDSERGALPSHFDIGSGYPDPPIFFRPRTQVRFQNVFKSPGKFDGVIVTRRVANLPESLIIYYRPLPWLRRSFMIAIVLQCNWNVSKKENQLTHFLGKCGSLFEIKISESWPILRNA